MKNFRHLFVSHGKFEEVSPEPLELFFPNQAIKILGNFQMKLSENLKDLY
jgi:hypothetical protein